MTNVYLYTKNTCFRQHPYMIYLSLQFSPDMLDFILTELRDICHRARQLLNKWYRLDFVKLKWYRKAANIYLPAFFRTFSVKTILFHEILYKQDFPPVFFL